MPEKHKRLREIIFQGGGGAFRGVQRVPAFKKKPAYAIVYFDSPQTGSTMTMKVRGITPAQVHNHLRNSDAKFEKDYRQYKQRTVAGNIAFTKR